MIVSTVLLNQRVLAGPNTLYPGICPNLDRDKLQIGYEDIQSQTDTKTLQNSQNSLGIQRVKKVVQKTSGS